MKWVAYILSMLLVGLALGLASVLDLHGAGHDERDCVIECACVCCVTVAPTEVEATAATSQIDSAVACGEAQCAARLLVADIFRPPISG